MADDSAPPPKREAFVRASSVNMVHVQVHPHGHPGGSQQSTDSSYAPKIGQVDAGMSGTDGSGDEYVADEDIVEEAPIARNKVFISILESTDVAKAELAKIMTKRSHQDGWCCISDLKPSKKEGYIQVSIQGHNHIMVLQNLVLAASGFSSAIYNDDLQASHLCHNRRCGTVGHIVPESAERNNNRKGCRGWVPCPHASCQVPIFICPHSPTCIRYHPEYPDMQALIDAHKAGHK